jgi:hypothetical protein
MEDLAVLSLQIGVLEVAYPYLVLVEVMRKGDKHNR